MITGLLDSAVELGGICSVYVCVCGFEPYAKYVHSSLVSPGAPGSHHDVNGLTGPTALLAFPPSICSSFFYTLLWLLPTFVPSFRVAYSVIWPFVPSDKCLSQPGCNLCGKNV